MLAIFWRQRVLPGQAHALCPKRIGVGYYTRSNAELCLVAIRGKIASYKRLLEDEAPRGASAMSSIVHESGPAPVNFLSLLDDSSTPVVMTPRREHSRKPPVVSEMITRLLGDLPRTST